MISVLNGPVVVVVSPSQHLLGEESFGSVVVEAWLITMISVAKSKRLGRWELTGIHWPERPAGGHCEDVKMASEVRIHKTQ